MKSPEESIRELVSSLHDETSAEADRRILMELSAVMDRKRNARRGIPLTRWRNRLGRILENRLFRFASATVVALAVVLPFLLLHSSTTRAYALEDTLKAIDRIRTVHMAGEFYQGKFECWMQFEDNPDEPAYLWLVSPRIPNLQRICTPEESFTFNPRTKALFQCRRDERKQPWIIHFGSFFKESLAAAKTEKGVSIGKETDAQTSRELITVDLRSKTRDQKFFVDPATKLPVRFVTLRDDTPQVTTRRGLAIRNIDWIRYNEPVPQGLFDVSAGATVVSEEPDVFATPENGLDAVGLSREDACRALLKRMGQAMIDGDIAKLRQCAPFFWVVKDETFAQARATAEKTGRIPVELTVQGNAYHEGDHWFLPCAIHNRNGSVEHSTAMIKFYRFGDQERCMVIGSKEKGVYD